MYPKIIAASDTLEAVNSGWPRLIRRALCATSTAMTDAISGSSRKPQIERIKAMTAFWFASASSDSSSAGIDTLPCSPRDARLTRELRREPRERRVPSLLGMPEALGIEAVDEHHARAAAEVLELDARDHGLGHPERGHRVRAQHEQRRRLELEDRVAGGHLLAGLAVD